MSQTSTRHTPTSSSTPERAHSPKSTPTPGSSTPDSPTPGPSTTTSSFAELGVPAPLLAVLTAEGKTAPFPIQTSTLPDTLSGRDVLGRGKTGSGKTLAFSLPIAARLGRELAGGTRRKGRVLGLILAPTRELATQIDATLAPLAAAYGLTTTTIFGGVAQSRQVAALKAGVDIIVACPGRLEDLMQQRFVSLDAVEITVIDEADHMADLGFLPAVTRILSATPSGGQRMLFSATLDNGVDKLVARFLHNEVRHSVDDVTSHVDAMTHHVFEVQTPEEKTALVRTLASGTGRRILFMRTKHHAKKLAKQLTASGIPAVDLHGNLSQPQRDRNLAAFSDGSVKVMVATDVAARGVHVDDIELVVHVDPPTEHKAYLHRSGRTARAGSAGDVVTISLPTQRKDLALLLRKASIDVAPQLVTADSDAVARLVGEVAPHVTPVAVSAKPARTGGAARSGRSEHNARAASGRGEITGQRTRGGDSTGGGRRTRGGQRPSDGQREPGAQTARDERRGGTTPNGRANTTSGRAAGSRSRTRRASTPAGGSTVRWSSDSTSTSASASSGGGHQHTTRAASASGGARRGAGGRRAQRPQG